jgi:alkyl hydroperoxide reductase subunit AhpC
MSQAMPPLSLVALNRGTDMALSIGETAPDFRAETTIGPISFHDWLGSSWCVMFSHPKDFTPVCTTELGAVARMKPEFDRRDVKIVGLSIDSVDNHAKWSRDIAAVTGIAPNYPMIGDTDLKVAKLYGMLPVSAEGMSDSRSPADNATVRTVYVIGPDRQIKAMISYPMSTGRNFDEVLRLVDSVQLTAKAKVATPVNWRQGEDVIIVPAVTEAEAKQRFPDGWKAPLPYMRVVPQPAV